MDGEYILNLIDLQWMESIYHLFLVIGDLDGFTTYMGHAFHCHATLGRGQGPHAGRCQVWADQGQKAQRATWDLSNGTPKWSLVGGLEPWNFMTFHILGIIIPTDFHIFFRVVETTNQMHFNRIFHEFPCIQLLGSWLRTPPYMVMFFLF